MKYGKLRRLTGKFGRRQTKRKISRNRETSALCIFNHFQGLAYLFKQFHVIQAPERTLKQCDAHGAKVYWKFNPLIACPDYAFFYKHIRYIKQTTSIETGRQKVRKEEYNTRIITDMKGK